MTKRSREQRRAWSEAEEGEMDGTGRPHSTIGTVLLIVAAMVLGMGLFVAFVACAALYDGLFND